MPKYFDSLEKLSFRFHGNYGGPNYCGGTFLADGEPCDYTVEPVDALDGLFRAHDLAYDTDDHSVADKNYVDQYFQLWGSEAREARQGRNGSTGKGVLAPNSFDIGTNQGTNPEGTQSQGGSGFGYDTYLNEFPQFLKGGLAALGFAIKSFGAAAPTLDNSESDREGIKNSQVDSDMTKKDRTPEQKAARRERRKLKRQEKSKAKKHVPVSKPARATKAIAKVVKTEKALARQVANKVSAAPPIGRKFIDGYVRRSVRNGNVVVEACTPLGPISMATTDKYLDIKQVANVNPYLFTDTTVISEAKIHEKYTVRHRLVYQSYCGSTTGGAMSAIFDPDPHDDYGATLNRGADLQNQWKLQFNCFQEDNIASKVVKSKLLWTSDKPQGLPEDEVTDTRLTSAGTWIIYVRAPPSVSATVGEFSLISEFTFYKTANEGMADYGLSYRGESITPANELYYPVYELDGINASDDQICVGSQMDQQGKTGFGLGTVNDIGLWLTQQAGTWMVTCELSGTWSGGTPEFFTILTYHSPEVYLFKASRSTSTGGGYTAYFNFIVQLRERHESFCGFGFQLTNNTAITRSTWMFVPINNQTYDVLKTNVTTTTYTTLTGTLVPPTKKKSIKGKAEVPDKVYTQGPESPADAQANGKSEKIAHAIALLLKEE